MTIYEKISPDNTEPTLRIALERAARMSTDVILASSTGASAFAALEMAKDIGFTGRIVAITSVWGMGGPGKNPLSEEDRGRLEDAGVQIVTAGHALSGVERSLSGRFKGVYPTEIMAQTLKLLSEGVKVCVEIGVMAMDAGKAEYMRPVVAVGGTGRGCDTACVLTPSYSASIFETRVHEILCKPY